MLKLDFVIWTASLIIITQLFLYTIDLYHLIAGCLTFLKMIKIKGLLMNKLNFGRNVKSRFVVFKLKYK